MQIRRQPVGGAGEHGRAQHDELAVGEPRQQCVDAVLDDAAHRIEEFVDRRTNGDDHWSASRDAVGRVGENQAVVG